MRRSIDLGSEQRRPVAGRRAAHANSRARHSLASAPCDRPTPPTLARGGDSISRTCIIEGVDDAVVRAMVLPLTFRARFAAALREPPPALGAFHDVAAQNVAVRRRSTGACRCAPTRWLAQLA